MLSALDQGVDRYAGTLILTTSATPAPSGPFCCPLRCPTEAFCAKAVPDADARLLARFNTSVASTYTRLLLIAAEVRYAPLPKGRTSPEDDAHGTT